MASSSSSIPPKVKFDVFISFRGADTRQTFISHLHDALKRRQLETFVDYKLDKGDEVGSALLEAIRESKISIIVFSNDYASSTWCLDELAYILECKEEYGQHVIPIFYQIEPSQVRYQSGNYETAFSKHEEWFKDEKDKVAKWKEALIKASNLSGFDSAAKTVRDDSDLVEQVVTDVLDKLNRESSVDLSGVIGAEGRIQKILLELDIIPQDDRVRYLVIWGMGGIGKTTLADAVFQRLSSQFEAHCFVANVREQSGTIGSYYPPQLYKLRNELLRELLGDKSLDIRTPTIGAAYKKRLQRAKVLVVLDDVNASSQLKFLAQEVPFGGGSRIIITTRDKQSIHGTPLVKQEVYNGNVKIYKMEELNDDESLQVVHSKAPALLKENSEFVAELVKYADGIPLALEILLSIFGTCNSKKELEVRWGKMKEYPDTRLQNVYRESYDGLQRNEREIFLDIACFHKGESREDVNRILDACGLYPDDGIKILIDMSLISIKSKRIWMHDVIQEFAWNIVSEEGELGTRSRVYRGEDVCHIFNTGTGKVKGMGITRRFNHISRIKLGPRAFEKMKNLRFLKLDFYNIYGEKAYLEYLPPSLQYLEWHWYPFQSLPTEFSMHNLVELKMSYSKLVRLWGKDQNPRNLRRIDLESSFDLVEVDGLSNSFNIESIDFSGCNKLLQVPDLSKCLMITSIDLQGCERLVQVSGLSNSLHLKSINLSQCSSLAQVPDLSNSLDLESIYLFGCSSLKQIPSYFRNFTKLTRLDLRYQIYQTRWNT